MNRYMILKNGKVIEQASLETMGDVKAAISHRCLHKFIVVYHAQNHAFSSGEIAHKVVSTY